MARKFTDKQIIDALEKSGGLVTQAAEALECDRTTIHRRVQQSATLKSALAACRERNLDLAEHALLGQVESGNMTAIIFLLKCLGKARGFVERHEIVTPADGELKIVVEHVKHDSAKGVSGG